MVRDYRATVNEMETNSRVASMVQDTRSDGGNAALMLQRYAISGDETLVADIRESAASAVAKIQQAALVESASSNPSQAITLAQVAIAAGPLAESADNVIALRQSGRIAEAEAALEPIVPQFRQFRIVLGQVADAKLAEVSARSADAHRVGNQALALIIITGATGLTVALAAGYVVTHSITRPLIALEATARRIGEGDLDTRAEPRGPRELRSLGATINDMASRLQLRESDLVLANNELRERNRQLLEARVQAATDGLTALPNHRCFHERIREAITAAEGAGDRVSAIMLDIDHFKRVNDALGHLVGDQILRACGDILSATTGADNVYRYGGDEFALILEHTSIDEATEIAEELRNAVVQRSPYLRGITISLGVAEYPAIANSAEELIYRADAAMYAAKSAGKNRTCRWDRMIEPSSSPAPEPRRSAPVR